MPPSLLSCTGCQGAAARSTGRRGVATPTTHLAWRPWARLDNWTVVKPADSGSWSRPGTARPRTCSGSCPDGPQQAVQQITRRKWSAPSTRTCNRLIGRQPGAASSPRWPPIAVRFERPLPAVSPGWLTAWRLPVRPAAAITRGQSAGDQAARAVGSRGVRAASGPAPFRFGDGVGRIGVSGQERGPGAGSAEGATGTGGPGRRAG